MKRPLQAGAALIGTLIAGAALAADAEPWPWIENAAPDLALATLPEIDSVAVEIDALDPPTVSVSVEAMAPTPGFTELQLIPVKGGANDQIFTFEAKGRPPQDVTTQVLTPVTIAGKYKEAPVANIAVIEVRGVDNCKAYSVKDKAEAACTTAPVPPPSPPQ